MEKYIDRFFYSIFSIIIIVVLLGALFFANIMFQTNFVGPRKHSRNTEAAEEKNDRIWSHGVGKKYVIRVKTEFDGIERSKSIEVICAKKTETGYIPLTSGPRVWNMDQSFGERSFRFRVSDEYDVNFRIGTSCPELARQQEKQALPIVLQGGLSVEIRHLSDPAISCRRSLRSGGFQVGSLRVFPLVVQSASQEKVRKLLSREAYGPADRAILYKLNRDASSSKTPRIPLNNQYFWSNESKCWENSGSDCPPLAQKLCAPLSR